MSGMPIRVHADFNDIEENGRIYVLQAHAEQWITNDELVLVMDAEGNSMFGFAEETKFDPNGCYVKLLDGSWWAAAAAASRRIQEETPKK